MYHLSVVPAKIFHLSVGEPYACILYHIHVSCVFCMAAVAIISLGRGVTIKLMYKYKFAFVMVSCVVLTVV